MKLRAALLAAVISAWAATALAQSTPETAIARFVRLAFATIFLETPWFTQAANRHS